MSRMRQLAATLSLTAFGAVTLPLTASAAALDHWDRFSCYAYVHGQCYTGNEDHACTEESYNEALDECDGYYPSAAIKRPAAPKNLTIRSDKPGIRAVIMKSFTKKN